MPFLKGYTPWNKNKRGINSGIKNPFFGKTHSNEQKEKWSKERMGVRHNHKTSNGGGWHLSEATKKKIGKAHSGSKCSFYGLKGDKNINWKGDEVGYFALHDWIERYYGKANKCEKCKTLKAKRYEWSNISQAYKRDIIDWQQLCVSCHRKYDWKMSKRIPWNKKSIYFQPAI